MTNALGSIMPQVPTKGIFTMADVNRGNRPLSPHLSIYKPQLSSFTSIMTRITGNALLISTVLLVWWLMAASGTTEQFDFVNGLLTSVLGDLVMLFTLLGIWYHLLAGLRHLIWDHAIGLDLESAAKLSWMVLGGSVVLTFFTIAII